MAVVVDVVSVVVVAAAEVDMIVAVHHHHTNMVAVVDIVVIVAGDVIRDHVPVLIPPVSIHLTDQTEWCPAIIISLPKKNPIYFPRI